MNKRRRWKAKARRKARARMLCPGDRFTFDLRWLINPLPALTFYPDAIALTMPMPDRLVRLANIISSLK